MTFVNRQFSFDGDTLQGGALLGDSTLQNIQSDLRRVALAVVDGLPGGLNTLTQVGFTTSKSDQLLIDPSKLQAMLAAIVRP